MTLLSSAAVMDGESSARKPVAVITGGTRGIGRGIAESLAALGYDLLLTYNTDIAAATEAAAEIETEFASTEIILFGGDISDAQTRKRVWSLFDAEFKLTHELRAVVHNAGQYVGVTSSNMDELEAQRYLFGDGSMLKEDGTMQLEQMHYYQRLYGDAYVEIMELGLSRMSAGGSLVGISSPGCNSQQRAQPGYDMPGSGKCVMEYAMRLFAIRAAPKKVNVNVVIPGVTETEAWYRFGQQRGFAPEQMLEMMRSRAPSGEVISPREIGAVVSFLCSASGKHITGISLPVDGGLHLGAPPPTGQWTADGKGSAGGAQGDEKTSAPSQGTKPSAEHCKTEQRRLSQQFSPELAPTAAEASQAWLSAWRRRLECWWILLPSPTQTQLGACVGALGIHLGSRLDMAWRSSGLGNAPNAAAQAAAAVSDEPGCEWLSERIETLALPDFPEMIEGLQLRGVPPVPSLLPSWHMMDWRALAEAARLARKYTADPVTWAYPAILALKTIDGEQTTQQASQQVPASAGIALGAGVALAMTGLFMLRRRREGCGGRPALRSEASVAPDQMAFSN